MKWAIWIGCCFLVALLVLLPYLFTIPPLNQIWIVKLENRLEGQVDAKSASFTWLGPQKIQSLTFQSPSLQGSAEEIVSPLPFWRIKGFPENFELHQGNLQTQEGIALENIEVKVDSSHIFATGVSSEGGNFQIEQKGELVQASVQKIPTILLDRLAQAKGLVQTTMGLTFDATGWWNAQNQEFRFELSSPNAAGTVEGVYRDSSLFLTKPLSSSLLVTPALTTRLNLPPARGRLDLTIAPHQFQCPFPFQLDGIQVGQGQIRAGTFEMSSNAEWQKLGSILKSSALNRGTLEIRSTPIDFSIAKGMLRLERLDFLINRSIHFCLWGKINLMNQRLDLNLGIPAQTLASILGIPGLQANAVLKIPVRGTLSNPAIETGPAAAKIATLTATQMIPKKGLWQLVPKVLDVTLDDQGDIPPQRYPTP